MLLLAACEPVEKPETDVPDGPDNGNSTGEYNTAWEKFVHRTDDNVLLDFSYAGYDHGETAPPDIWSLGYKKYDVTDFGAVPDDGKSDRQAFLDAINAALGGKGWQVSGENYNYDGAVPKANAIIYFPAGYYILYDRETDDIDGKSLTITLRAGHIAIAGAGRDKTFIEMADPYRSISGSPDDYASQMLCFKHWSGFNELSDVEEDASKGDFSVKVSSTSGLSKGMWVALTLGDGANGTRGNNDPEVVAEELYPYPLESWMTQLKNTGVIGAEIHQIASVRGNVVRFEEPILRNIRAGWGWKLSKYNYYENVAVEDLTFVGHAVEHFVHDHWEETSQYGPLLLMRLVNSWVRRVNFHSVTSAVGFSTCANCSAYDIVIDGNMGHTAVNASKSTRVFIGKTKDVSDSDTRDGAGQHHANGVSKWSNGTVIWNCEWGIDSNFESHATQPRATLFDMCRGGFLRSRQGGAASELPNHLDDLTLWNFEALNVPQRADDWDWWLPVGERGWRFMPPTVVGFHGVPVKFREDQMKLNESQGTPVEPLSLYEAQLKLRLGAVPKWLNDLKVQ